MDSIAILEPTSKGLVFDLAREAGLDMSDWIASSQNPANVKANPKYCYEWSFWEPGKFIILNLWHTDLKQSGDTIVVEGNFRDYAERSRSEFRKQSWARRALHADQALQRALSDNLSIRVILLVGERRAVDLPQDVASLVKYRELDPELWTITMYDWETGAFQVTRGIMSGEYVDQFDLSQHDRATVETATYETTTYVRSPEIRRRVLARARGHCELCGEKGFRMASGALYLETHHIVPLSEAGSDDESNVVALCPTDHRKAHYGADRESIRALLLGTGRPRHRA